MADKNQFLDKTGLALLCNKLIALISGKANATHNHDAATINSGTISSERLPVVPITKGGTGATNAADALKNLGIEEGANKYTHPDTHDASMITGLATVATSGSYDDLKGKPSASDLGLNTESWVFTLENGSTVTKAVYVG